MLDTQSNSDRSVSRGREAYVSLSCSLWPPLNPTLHSNPPDEVVWATSGVPPNPAMRVPSMGQTISRPPVAASPQCTRTESVSPIHILSNATDV